MPPNFLKSYIQFQLGFRINLWKIYSENKGHILATYIDKIYTYILRNLDQITYVLNMNTYSVCKLIHWKWNFEAIFVGCIQIKKYMYYISVFYVSVRYILMANGQYYLDGRAFVLLHWYTVG